MVENIDVIMHHQTIKAQNITYLYHSIKLWVANRHARPI